MDKIVIITGGSSGIGKELIALFNKNGDTAVSLSRTNPENSEHFIFCDVSDEKSVKSAFKSVKEIYGRVDLLINNAGLGVSGAAELLPIKDIDKVIDTDYYGSLYAVRSALPLMERGGKIVFVSSACALFALPFRGVYCSAKAAVNMLAFSLRMELKNSGIKVVSICPGDIKSEFTKNRIKDFSTNERYGGMIETAAGKVDGREHKRMDNKRASAKIFRIALKKNGPLYIVGFKYKVFYFFQRILPARLFIKITGKLFT